MRGHSATRSRTFPYQVSRIGPLWLMRDAPRKSPRDYRKEEWIAHDVDPRKVDATARHHTRGRFFVCAMIADGEPDETTRTTYKALGYRLLATEGFFVQPLKRIPKPPSPVSIERVRTPDLAARLGKVTRTRPISSDLLGDDAPFRQYMALDGQEHRWSRAQRGCRRSELVRGHVRRSQAPASRYRAGASVTNVAGRSSPRFEVLCADRKSHRGALISSRGL